MIRYESLHFRPSNSASDFDSAVSVLLLPSDPSRPLLTTQSIFCLSPCVCHSLLSKTNRSPGSLLSSSQDLSPNGRTAAEVMYMHDQIGLLDVRTTPPSHLSIALNPQHCPYSIAAGPRFVRCHLNPRMRALTHLVQQLATRSPPWAARSLPCRPAAAWRSTFPRRSPVRGATPPFLALPPPFRQRLIPFACGVAAAELWSVGRPHLYTVAIQLLDGGAVVDSVNLTTGIRAARFDPQRGLHLNDQRVKLRGFCDHSNFGGVGGAVPDRLNLYRAQARRRPQSPCRWTKTQSSQDPKLLITACVGLGPLA